MITTEATREFQAKERKYKKQLKRCLSWALSQDLNWLLKEELEADITLFAGSDSLRAHRAILLARAPHVFQGQTHEDPTIIHLSGYDLPGLRDFIRRVYTADQSTRSAVIITDVDDVMPETTEYVPGTADLHRSTDSDAVVLMPASGLGADLLDLYQRGEQCDITVQVAEHSFSCHRAVLCARSQYFRAMLSGCWMESSRQCITLQGLGPDEMEILLQYMYGAIVDLPPGANASQVMLAADMLSLEGLKDVGEMVLTRDYCHFFPKSVDGVQRTVLECLSLTHAFGLQNLHELCKRWVAEHFMKTWCERNFSLLSPELQRACLTAVTETMTVQNAVTVLCDTEQLLSSLPEVKWAQHVRSLATELQEESLRVIVQHLPVVTHTQAFHELRRREEFTQEPTLLRKLCSAIREAVTVENCCDLFNAVNTLCGDNTEEEDILEQRWQRHEPFRQEICTLQARLWTFLLQTFYAIRHTQGWETLSSKYRARILADAIDKGDTKRLAKKPVFTSSQQRAEKCSSFAHESPPVQRKQRVSEYRTSSSCTAPSAMKSDGLATANKQGDGPSPSKTVKKPGDRTAPAKGKAASAGTPVVNGTGAAGARREVSNVNGPRGSHGAKEQEKKPNPGARPKTIPPSCTAAAAAAATKTLKVLTGKTDSTVGSSQAQAIPSSASGSTSPENGASSPRNNAHSTPGAKPKHQVKAVTKSLQMKSAQKSDATKTSTPTIKSSVKDGSKVKTGAVEKVSTAARQDGKGRGTPDHLVSKHGSSMKKPPSPKKDDKNGLKSSTGPKAGSETPKKKVMKPVADTGTKSVSVKLVKASLATSKQIPAVAAKSGPKLSSTTVDKTSPKCARASKTSAAATPTKKAVTKGKCAVTSKNTDSKSELVVVNKENKEAAPSADKAAESSQPTNQGGEDLLSLHSDCSSTDHNLKTTDTSVTRAANDLKSDHTGNKVQQIPCSVIPGNNSEWHVHDVSSPNSQRDTEPPTDTPCMGSTVTQLEDTWSSIHPQVSPESETGSMHTTSSDDIKPRSEDYDAGGSQDDDFSNDRGVSKCGTMRCHDFLGRSSSDTSTPEELKIYVGGAGLRVEVRLRGREAETTSEEEAVRCRPPSWLQRDEVEEKNSEVEATMTGKSVPDPQLFSSEDEEEDDNEEETEEERSEVEVIPGQASVAPTEPSPHFQGIVNLAFDDEGFDQETDQPDYQSTSNFRRSVLLSVDECEELGSEEGSVQTPPQKSDVDVTPCDVFESESTAFQQDSAAYFDQQNHPENTGIKEDKQEEKSSVFLTEIQESMQGANHVQVDGVKSNIHSLDTDTRDLLPPQERPCHLDLRNTEQYNGSLRKNHSNSSENKKADLHLDLNDHQLTGDSPAHAAQSSTGNV